MYALGKRKHVFFFILLLEEATQIFNSSSISIFRFPKMNYFKIYTSASSTSKCIV